MADEDWYGMLNGWVCEYWYFLDRGEINTAIRVGKMLEEYLCWQDETGMWTLPNLD